MKNYKLKLAIASAFGLNSYIASATGFVALPNTGFTVSDGISAYTLCSTNNVNPTQSANNTCAVFPSSEFRSPGDPAEYTGVRQFPVANKTRPVVVDNTYTTGPTTIGNYVDYVWRSDDDSECIYGVKVVLNSYYQINDIARGGWSGLGVFAAYSTVPVTAHPVSRIGLTYTSVQRRYGYIEQPLTGLGSSPSINGLNAYPGTASSIQQKADIDDNWVNFTSYISGSTSNSGMFYVKSDVCPAMPYTQADNAIRLRRTFQGPGEYFTEISLPGFAPNDAVLTPIHTEPY
ncbi:hypothetical protein [Methylophaga thalassica]|jgi:hypothetical protein|uniref:hypothetical protein n=1 Tax=Methylophaga thalassica TaxID=40223 RepID=UPI002E7B77B9|nr:hypothetical protein [Methylophaga thalassica]WVI86760.1 hypothetical protein VSX76_09120 [Methylophaga thalassica]